MTLPAFWSDVQALIGRGFINRRHSAHILTTLNDIGAAREWFSENSSTRTIKLASTLDVDGKKGDKGNYGEPFFQVAFTPNGLREFGAPDVVMNQFPDPFLSGMAPEPAQGAEASRRTGILGDIHDNHERHWDWGGRSSGIKWEDIHVLLMIFADDPDLVREEQEKALRDCSLRLAGPEDVAVTKTRLFMTDEDNDRHPKEHFGYVDGVSQPLIKGFPRVETKKATKPEIYDLHAVEPGEFVLGVKNERQITTPYPDIAKFGQNGSYLVLRQMEQDVPAFNRLVTDTARDMSQDTSRPAKELAAAKLMGRWRDGWPLAPKHGPHPYPLEERNDQKFPNDFGFAERDAGGLTCPLGSHVRRVNPRDAREDPPETALRLSKRHRILRRGRIYGDEPRNEDFDAGPAKKPSGLMFICLNADITQQFEFIQHTWLNNRVFAGLSGEVDPITTGKVADEAAFTIPVRPQAVKVQRNDALTTMKGGGIFLYARDQGAAHPDAGGLGPPAMMRFSSC